MIFLYVFSMLAVLVSILNLIRIDRFGKFLRAELDRISSSRWSDIRNGNNPKQPWPNVMASYRNLKWYDVFNYDFKSLMVYDNTY